MRKTTWLKRGVALVTLQSVWGLVAGAQCRPPKNSHEARLLAFYGMPIVFAADPTTLIPRGGMLRFSIDGAYVPTAPSSIQLTQECYTGRVQHTALTQVFGRPRLALTLPNGFGAEVSYLPPIRIADATPNLFGAALWLTRSVTDKVHMTTRIHMVRGTVHGPITCPSTALQQTDAQTPCYGTSASDDEFRPDTYGGELIASMTPRGPTSTLRLHSGLGVTFLRPRFGVDFSDLLGGRDRTNIAVDLTRISGLLGATVQITQRCQVATQGYASFGDGATVRGFLGCALLH